MHIGFPAILPRFRGSLPLSESAVTTRALTSGTPDLVTLAQTTTMTTLPSTMGVMMVAGLGTVEHANGVAL